MAKRRLLKTLLAAASALVTLACLEGAARVYLRWHPPTGMVERWEFRSSRPPAYQSADYFSKDFLTESMTCQRDFVNPPRTHFWIPGNAAGKLCNVSDGRRRTAYQPASGGNRVVLFGGSTVFCAEVPDTETLASQLQLLINNSSGPRLAVENYGVPAMNAAQQCGRLETLSLRPGDIVIFYDGVNDVYYPVYNGNIRGWLPGDGHDGGLRKLNGLERGMHLAFIRFGDKSSLVRLLFNVQARAWPHNVADQKTLERNLAEAEAGYRTALATARAFAIRSGAAFYHILQPNIFTLPHPSAHERWLIDNELKGYPGLDRAFAVAYPRLRAAASEACGDAAFDLSDVLQDAASRGEVYLDFCHVNHVANRLIAGKIFESLFPSRRIGGPAGDVARAAAGALKGAREQIQAARPQNAPL